MFKTISAISIVYPPPPSFIIIKPHLRRLFLISVKRAMALKNDSEKILASLDT